MLISYYRLNENKNLNGGIEISSNKNLYCLKSEDNTLFLLFESDSGDKVVFWADLADVTYINECEKEIDMSIVDLYGGNYFNLI